MVDSEKVVNNKRSNTSSREFQDYSNVLQESASNVGPRKVTDISTKRQMSSLSRSSGLSSTLDYDYVVSESNSSETTPRASTPEASFYSSSSSSSEDHGQKERKVSDRASLSGDPSDNVSTNNVSTTKIGAAEIDNNELEKGHSYFDKKQFSKAETSYSLVIRKVSTKDNRVLMALFNYRAAALLEQGHYQKCIGDCASAIKLAYNHMNDEIPAFFINKVATSPEEQLKKALCCKAQALEALDKYEAAIVLYEEAASLNSSLDKSFLEKIKQCKQALFYIEGKTLFNQGKFKESEIRFTNAINALTSNSENLILLYSNRAAAFMEQHQYENCLDDCDLSIELATHHIATISPITPSLLLKLGTTIEVLCSETLFCKASALEALGRYQDAIQVYGRAKSFDYSKESQATNNAMRCRNALYKERGSSYFKKGQFKEAEEAYTYAINGLNPDDGDLILLLNNRAAAFLKQNEYENSLRDCESLIRMAKEAIRSQAPITPMMKKADTNVLVQLVKALLRQGLSLEGLDRYQQAIKVYKDKLLNDGKDSNAKEGIRRCEQCLHKDEGDSFFETGQYASAEMSYSHAINLSSSKNGDLVVLLNKRAAALMEQGKHGACLTDCKSVIWLADYCIRIKAPVTAIMKKMATTFQAQLVKASIRKARSLEGLKLYQDAIHAYEDAKKLDFSNEVHLTEGIQQCKQAIFLEEGDSSLQRGLFGKAEIAYTNAISISKSQDLIFLWRKRALTLLKQYKYDKCLQDCESAIETYEMLNHDGNNSSFLMKKTQTDVRIQYIKILMCKAQAYEALREHQAAITVYEELWSQSGRDCKIISCIEQCKQNLLKEEGNSFFKKRQFKLAEKSYSRAIMFLPPGSGDLVLFLNNRAAAYMEQREWESCFNDCTSAIRIAQMLIERNDVSNGIIMKITDTTVELQLKKSLVRKARALEALSKYQEAIQAYKEGIRHNPNDSELKQRLKECKQIFFMEQGDSFVSKQLFTRAQKSYSDAIEVTALKTNDLIVLWNKRAVAFMKQHKFADSLKDYIAAIGLAYDNMKAKSVNSPLMKKIDTTIEAQLINALFSKGHVLETTKKYKAAIVAYEDIVLVNEAYKEKVAECISRCKKQIPDPVKELREREKKKKAEEAEKLAYEEQVNKKISSWISGREYDFKALVCSLEVILWPEVHVKNTTLSGSSKAQDFKKLYFKIIAKIHPDKLPQNSTIEQQLLAKSVFQVLNDSWEKFKNQHNL